MFEPAQIWSSFEQKILKISQAARASASRQEHSISKQTTPKTTLANIDTVIGTR
jgi:hypothetical protein